MNSLQALRHEEKNTTDATLFHLATEQCLFLYESGLFGKRLFLSREGSGIDGRRRCPLQTSDNLRRVTDALFVEGHAPIILRLYHGSFSMKMLFFVKASSHGELRQLLFLSDKLPQNLRHRPR